MPKQNAADDEERSPGVWLISQRSRFANLSEERVQALRSVDGLVEVNTLRSAARACGLMASAAKGRSSH